MAPSGLSVLELPWFEDDTFVARQPPEITEMPPDVCGCASSTVARHYGARPTGSRIRRFVSALGPGRLPALSRRCCVSA